MSATRVGVETVAGQDVADRGPVEQVVNLVVVAAGPPADEVLGLVAVGAVTDVVEERGGADVGGAVAVDAEVREGAGGEVVDAEAVFEPRVARRGIDEPDRRELFDVSKPLERGRIDQFGGHGVERDVVVDAVLDGGHSGCCTRGVK